MAHGGGKSLKRSARNKSKGVYATQRIRTEKNKLKKAEKLASMNAA